MTFLATTEVVKAHRGNKCNYATNNPDKEAQKVRNLKCKGLSTIGEQNILHPVGGEQTNRHYRHLT